MLCRMVLVQRKKKVGSVPVYLNVYDLTPINGYAYWLGLGIYHSGVQGTLLFLFLSVSGLCIIWFDGVCAVNLVASV